MGLAALRARAKERPPEDIRHGAAKTPRPLPPADQDRSRKPDRLFSALSVEMEDFEYSVEICDRDWECFFAECEECNLLPPSLAGVDDSGMSDFDDAGSMFAKRVQKADLLAGFSEADRPIDGPPHCEGSPVEHYLGKHGISGMESVLSGSEEDIHLQSVNIFFEGLKRITEAEKPAAPSQVRAGKNREATQREEKLSDGQKSSSGTLPVNITKINSLRAKGETSVGREGARPVDAISNVNTMKKVESGSNVSPGHAAGNLVHKTNRSAHPETELFIQEEACTETRVSEVTQWNESRGLPDWAVHTGTTPRPDKAIRGETHTPPEDVERERSWTSQLTLSDKRDPNSPTNLEMARNVKKKEEQSPPLLQFDASSPSASVKRKRRKKRRLSFEPAESAHGCERQFPVKLSDSEEEHHAWRGGTSLCLSEDANLFYFNESQKNVVSSLCSVTSNLPVRTSAMEIRANDFPHTLLLCDTQYPCLPDSDVRLGGGKAMTNDVSVTALSQTDNNVIAAISRGNAVANLLPYIALQAEESPRLGKYSWLPVSVSASVNGKSDTAGETVNSDGKGTPAESLQQPDNVNHSVPGCENEQNFKTCPAEVESITCSILPSGGSNDPTVEPSQCDKLSEAKSVLAVEAGNTGGGNHALCHREAEPQQQLEIDCHDADQYSSTLVKTHSLDTKPQQFKSGACPFSDEISNKVTCAESASDCVISSPDGSCLATSPSRLKHPMEVQTSSKIDNLSEKNVAPERVHMEASQITTSSNPCPSGDTILTGSSGRVTKLSMSEDLITSPSDITTVSSCCTLDTESVLSLSNENITDLSESQSESGGLGGKLPLILAKDNEGDAESGPKSQSVLNNSAEPKEDAVIASRAEREPKKAPESRHFPFAMSSFWSEMEKLTINDILGLRMIGKAAPPISLPPLEESEETGTFSPTDSGCFSQLEGSKPEKINEYTPSVPDSAESALDSFVAVDSSSSSRYVWESECVPESPGADIYPENVMLTSLSDISHPVLSGSAQKSLRKISKNISVHDLQTLECESFSSTWKGQTLQTLGEGQSEKDEYFSNEPMPKQDKDSEASSLSDSYRISLTDIFQCLFGGKKSAPSQSATDNITTFHIEGNSVPETYDHFFSEFGTENFLGPLFAAEDEAKEEPVPIFSYSHSANRNLQFPEAYDYFFASSSSDDSSVESDEEDNSTPVRVVTRFSRKASEAQISTDTYENFFTDSDLGQNFFWKTTFSFRNVNFATSKVQKQTLSNSLSCVPARRSDRSLQRTVYPSNVLGHQDVMFPNLLLYHLEDRISRQRAQQPFRYEDLQTANPRLDASLLPLRQSDMCLVCIAFASWVLKTANPEVGDAWKAVLLANVSALSAIRYLRRYVRMEGAASEKKMRQTGSSEFRALCL